MAQHLDSKCPFPPAPLVPGVFSKPRLESRFCNAYEDVGPRFIYDRDCLYFAGLLHAADAVSLHAVLQRGAERMGGHGAVQQLQ